MKLKVEMILDLPDYMTYEKAYKMLSNLDNHFMSVPWINDTPDGPKQCGNQIRTIKIDKIVSFQDAKYG